MYIGHNSAHCTVSHCWSPDSRLFLTSTLAPRMNVDNGFKIFKYNGIGPVIHHTWDSTDPLYYAQWHPQSIDLFPNRGQSPKRQHSDGDAAAATASVSTTTAPVVAAAAAVKPKAAPYRPPGSTGSLSAMLRKEEAAPVGKVKPVTAGGEGGNKKPVTPVIAPRRIPGMAPPPAPAPKNGMHVHTIYIAFMTLMLCVCYLYIVTCVYRDEKER